MSNIRQQSIITGLSLGSGLLIGFVNSVWLFPKYIGVETLGLVQWMVSVMAVIGIVGGLGINATITKFYPYFKEKKAHFLSFSLLYLAIGSTLSLLLLFVFKDWIIGTFNDENSSYLAQQYYNLLYFGIVFLLSNELLLSYARSLFKGAIPSFIFQTASRIYVLFLIVGYCLSLITLPTFVVLYMAKFGLVSLFFCIYLGSIGALKLANPIQVLRSNKIKEIYQFSAFTILGHAGFLLLGQIDTLMLSSMRNYAEAGVYGIFATIAALIFIPRMALSAVIAPLFSEAIAENKPKNVEILYKRVTRNVFVAGLLLFICIVINIQNVILFYEKDIYTVGFEVTIILGLAQLLNSFLGLSGTILINSKFYKFSLIAKFLMGFSATLLNYTLIPKYGTIGAATGTAIALIGVNITLCGYVFIKLKIDPFSKHLLKAVFIGIFLLFINFMLPVLPNIFIDTLYRTLIIVVFFFALNLYFTTSEDLSKLVNDYWKKLFQKSV